MIEIDEQTLYTYKTAFGAVVVVLGVQYLISVVSMSCLRGIIAKIDSRIPRFSVKSELKKSLLIIFCTLCVFGSMSYLYPSEQLNSVPVRPIYESLIIDNWGDYREKVTKRCYEIDINDPEHRRMAKFLMDHMQLRIPPKHEFVASNEFGSNARILYSTKYGAMVNPRITLMGKETKWIKCKGVVETRPAKIVVVYYDYRFEPRTIELSNQDALQLQCMFILFNS